MTDSQSSQCSNSSQKTGKRTVYAPPAATLSSIQSMQNASSLISEQLKNNSTAIENDSQTLRQEQTANDNLSNNLADLFTLQNLINGLGSNLDTQQTNLFPELDTSQFVAGLLMSTMTPVNNSQVIQFCLRNNCHFKIYWVVEKVRSVFCCMLQLFMLLTTFKILFVTIRTNL